MFTIRHKPSGLYCPKASPTYFIEDDERYHLRRSERNDDEYRAFVKDYLQTGHQNSSCVRHLSSGACFGKKKKYMKVFSSTEHIRRALGTVKYKTGLVTINGSLQIQMIQPCKENGVGTFTMYEVVNLITGECHKLEDVFNKKI